MKKDKKNPSGKSIRSDDKTDNSEDKEINGLVEELRHVLSDLKPSESTEKKEEPFEEPASSEPLNAAFSPLPSEEEPPLASSAPDFNASTPPAPDSDADFWAGNVLGWPNAIEENASPESPIVGEPGMKEPSGSPFSDDTGQPTAVPPGASEEQDAAAESIFGASVGEKGLDIQEFNKPLASDASLSKKSDPFIPEPPLSPAEIRHRLMEPDASAPEPVPVQPSSSLSDNAKDDELLESGKGPAPLMVPIPETINEKPIPIPVETKEELEAPSAPEESSQAISSLSQAPEPTEKGIVQIACVFPYGKEESGELFVARLRDMALKARENLNIQPVFIEPWAPGTVNVPAWEKSALQAGAHVMFVLLSRTDKETLKPLLNGRVKRALPNRLVYLDHISFQALYADIIVELRRTLQAND